MKYYYKDAVYEGDHFYCYPDSDVLMNRFDIRDYHMLQGIERDITAAKAAVLSAEPFKGVLDMKYLMRIHKFLFGEIYTWAGHLRGGQFLTKGEAVFCRADMIGVYAGNVFGKLREEKWLRGLPKEAFIERLAYYMAEINVIHPFREGNGRTARAFFEELTRRARYELNFGKVNPDELLQADINAYNKDYDLLIALLNKAVQ
ncbi:Fic family protein [Tyzzerella sp. OttesenSCG-928-J15]|nr:Fic family protein [Tyzzerella sp. OttesenSCG-928-J15]MDL2288003.1 Fic family protein [Oscillospiraceae bacterium OttesenSCG-928-F05]